MAKPKFKVIIAGGGITGLCLAHCLDQAGIDYVLLESHAEIAPRIGAAMGIMPNGARILDQLGIYSDIEKLDESLNIAYMSFADGFTYESSYPVTVNKRYFRCISAFKRSPFSFPRKHISLCCLLAHIHL